MLFHVFFERLAGNTLDELTSPVEARAVGPARARFIEQRAAETLGDCAAGADGLVAVFAVL